MKYCSVYLALDSICIDHFVLIAYYKLAPWCVRYTLFIILKLYFCLINKVCHISNIPWTKFIKLAWKDFRYPKFQHLTDLIRILKLYHKTIQGVAWTLRIETSLKILFRLWSRNIFLSTCNWDISLEIQNWAHNDIQHEVFKNGICKPFR